MGKTDAVDFAGCILLAHDLFRKPVPTFRDHALTAAATHRSAWRLTVSVILRCAPKARLEGWTARTVALRGSPLARLAAQDDGAGLAAPAAQGLCAAGRAGGGVGDGHNGAIVVPEPYQSLPLSESGSLIS